MICLSESSFCRNSLPRLFSLLFVQRAVIVNADVSIEGIEMGVDGTRSVCSVATLRRH